MISFALLLLMSIGFTRAFLQESNMTTFGFCLTVNAMLVLYSWLFFNMLKKRNNTAAHATIADTSENSKETFTVVPESRYAALNWYLTTESYSLLNVWQRTPVTIKRSELLFAINTGKCIMIFFKRTKENVLHVHTKPSFYDQLEIREYSAYKKQIIKSIPQALLFPSIAGPLLFWPVTAAIGRYFRNVDRVKMCGELESTFTQRIPCINMWRYFVTMSIHLTVLTTLVFYSSVFIVMYKKYAKEERLYKTVLITTWIASFFVVLITLSDLTLYRPYYSDFMKIYEYMSK